MTFDGTINLLCIRCGNAARTPRQSYDPPRAVRMEVNFCDLCDEGGWFEETWYFARNGREVHHERTE